MSEEGFDLISAEISEFKFISAVIFIWLNSVRVADFFFYFFFLLLIKKVPMQHVHMCTMTGIITFICSL